MESDLSDGENNNLSLLGSEEEEEEEASPKRRSFGLRVAFQFPTRKSAKKKVPEPTISKLHLQDNKPPKTLTREKSSKQWKKLEGSASESEEDVKEMREESSSALLKRAINIKENKAMVRQSKQKPVFTKGMSSLQSLLGGWHLSLSTQFSLAWL